MYNFILQIAIMIGLGTMVYLIGRATPRIGDEIPRQSGAKFDHLLNSLRLEKFDVVLGNFLEKFLRKIKLILMQMDNITSNYLNKVRKGKLENNGKNKENRPSLFENNSKEDEKENL